MPGVEVSRRGLRVAAGVEVSRPGVVEPESTEFRLPFPWGRPAAGCSWAPARRAAGEGVGAGAGGAGEGGDTGDIGVDIALDTGVAGGGVAGGGSVEALRVEESRGGGVRVEALRVEAWRVEALRVERSSRQLRLSVRWPAVRLDRDGVGDGDGGHRVRGGRDCCGESGQRLRIGDGRRGRPVGQCRRATGESSSTHSGGGGGTHTCSGRSSRVNRPQPHHTVEIPIHFSRYTEIRNERD